MIPPAPQPEAISPPALLVPRRKVGNFTLTPLADVMFQLLLFFMLTSSLAPYALLPMGGTEPQVQGDRTAPSPPANRAPAQAVWHLGHKEIRSGQVRIALEMLPQALDALKADGIQDLVVLVTHSAQTSDLVYVLEITRQADLARLQLVGG